MLCETLNSQNIKIESKMNTNFKDELDLINQEKRKSLRKLTSNDLDDVYNLIVKNKHRYIGIDSKEDTLLTIEEGLSFGVYIDNTQLAGVLLSFIPKKLDVFYFRKEETLISDILVVDTSFIKQGIAMQLKDKLKDVAKELGYIKYIASTVSPINLRMVNLNLRQGYKIDSLLRKKDDIQVPDFLEHSYSKYSYYQDFELELVPSLQESLKNTVSPVESYRYLMVYDVPEKDNTVKE